MSMHLKADKNCHSSNHDILPPPPLTTRHHPDYQTTAHPPRRTVFPLGLGERHPDGLRLQRGRQHHPALDVQLHHRPGVLQHLHRRGVVDVLQREAVGAQDTVVHAAADRGGGR